ncbi:hypothetical protein [Halorussus sp. GCM10023401]|uniref:hypothetical protein n=1 Tax=Halorussus sp. GCM10023401 TaxID=3252680 RepID=UPI003606B03D
MSVDPLESAKSARLIRSLFYLGDGMVVGAFLYFALHAVMFILYDFSANEVWLFGLMLAVVLLSRWWVPILLKRSSASEDSQQWTEIRSWPVVAGVAILVFGTLLVVQLLVAGWTLTWSLVESSQITILVALLGFVLRMFGRDLWSNDSTSQIG